MIRALRSAIQRKRAEIAQRHTEGQMRALCASIADVIFVLDLDGRFLKVLSTNPALLYKPPADLIGRTLREVLPADRADFFLGHVRHVLRTGESVTIDYSPTIGAEGLWFSAKISPLSSHSAVVVATETTARKQAEDQLRRRAEELAALQATVLQITVAHDLPTLLRTIVERAALLLNAPSGGLYLAEPGRQEVRCVVSYQTLRDYSGTVLKYGEGAAGVVAQTGRPLIVDDYRLWDKRAAVFDEERPFTALLSTPMIWQGRLTGVIHVLDKVEGRRFTQADLDLLTLFANHAAIAVENARLYDEAQRELAERQRAHAALQRSEEHFRALIEHAMDIIGVLNSDGTVRYFSPSVERVLGYSADESVGQPVLDFVHPDDVAVVARELAAVKIGPGSPLEMRLRHKDGSWRVIEGLAADLRHHPAVAGIVINARDITERKRLEDQLHQSQKMEALGNMAGGLCHDFNNRLMVIVGHSSLLLDGLRPDHPHYEALQTIDRTAQLAADSTRQLLAFSRHQYLEPQVLSLNDVVVQAAATASGLDSARITLNTTLAPHLGLVEIDPQSIEQVVQNLIEQAREAMPHGGRLLIETANAELDQAYAGVHPDVKPGRYVRLSVSDTGRGIDRKTVARIFEPFITTLERGTGLRLAVVYGIVVQSRGHIAVYSEVGLGTTFKAYLPRVDATAEDESDEPGESARAAGSETILLVEENLTVREMAGRYLSGLGYTILAAGGGSEARAVSRTHAACIHLLLIDVLMPGASGPGLAAELLRSRPDLAVLFTSGYPADFVASGYPVIPARHMLEKPYTLDALARKVREVLDARPGGATTTPARALSG